MTVTQKLMYTSTKYNCVNIVVRSHPIYVLVTCFSLIGPLITNEIPHLMIVSKKPTCSLSSRDEYLGNWFLFLLILIFIRWMYLWTEFSLQVNFSFVLCNKIYRFFFISHDFLKLCSFSQFFLCLSCKERVGCNCNEQWCGNNYIKE